MKHATDMALRASLQSARAAFGNQESIHAVNLAPGPAPGTFCLVVYVDELQGHPLLPDSFEGIPLRKMRLDQAGSCACGNQSTTSPLKMGTVIGRLRPGETSYGFVGTLGCFAMLATDSGRDNVYLLTNNHVLAHDSGANQDRVFQAYPPNGSVSSHVVADITNIGKKENHTFRYPGDPTTAPNSYYVDCAIAKVRTNYSSWCNTNMGVGWRSDFFTPQLNGRTRITGVYRVTQDDINANRTNKITVYKVGARGGASKGRIIKVDKMIPGLMGIPGYDNCIEIAPIQACDPPRFAQEGDSGSAVINEDGEIVGLQFSASDGSQVNDLACHIHPVMHYLGINIITDSTPAAGAESLSSQSGILLSPDAPGTPAEALDRVLLARPGGQALRDAIYQHREEIIRLVNASRPVSLAWQRHKGPTFLAHLMENFRHPQHPIPTHIDGISAEESLRAVMEALEAQGSPELRNSLSQHGPDLLDILAELQSPRRANPERRPEAWM